MKHTIYYATSNAGKFSDVKQYITCYASYIDLQQLAIDLPEQQTLDQKQIAIDKAKKAWRQLRKPLIVDDAGIYFDAYNQFPGPLTKFVHQGLGLEGILKLLNENNKATRLLYLIYIDGPDSFKTFEGTTKGTIIQPQNFDVPPTLPWDALFVPEGSKKTYGSIRGTKEFEQYNYRIKALKKFLQWFNQYRILSEQHYSNM